MENPLEKLGYDRRLVDINKFGSNYIKVLLGLAATEPEVFKGNPGKLAMSLLFYAMACFNYGASEGEDLTDEEIWFRIARIMSDDGRNIE